MCLAEVYTDEDMNRIVEELPEVALGVVEVWKAVAIGNYRAWGIPFKGDLYPSGIGKADTAKKIQSLRKKTYFSGYHFFLKKGQADYWSNFAVRNGEYIKCFIKKDWITAMGRQRFDNSGTDVVLVASQAFFPTYPQTEANLEDFLVWLEENDKEYAESQLCETGKK